MSTDKLTFHQVLRWSDEECRHFLEQMRWPNGRQCPKCGATDTWTLERKTSTKNKKRTLYKCRSCRRQFTATVGTIFEDSKITLNKWFAAIFLMCASKKGISAHQLHRTLDITYKSAWFMAHRVREATKEKGALTPFSGIVEADETYIGGKQRGHRVWRERIQDEVQMGLRPKRGRHSRMDKTPVFGMIERDGIVRTTKVSEVTARVAGAYPSAQSGPRQSTANHRWEQGIQAHKAPCPA